jgi:hypothetical protein
MPIMKSAQTRISLVIFLAMLVLVVCPSRSRSSLVDKIKTEEVVARHLDAIGSAKTRAAVATRIISGTAQVIFRTTPSGQAVGKAVLASQGNKSLFGMSFPSPVYPREQLAFNGNNFMAAFATAGNRSVLGNFLMANDVIFKQGLMCGALSAAWPLLDVPAHHAQLEYVGARKIDDRVLHELKYVPRGNTDLKISLFFDQENFRHVRTEYERVIPAPMGKVEYSNVQEREGRYKMIEEFSLFKSEGGLNLPHIYTIKLSVDTINGTFLAEWTIKLTQFEFNQRIDQNAFSVSTN